MANPSWADPQPSTSPEWADPAGSSTPSTPAPSPLDEVGQAAQRLNTWFNSIYGVAGKVVNAVTDPTTGLPPRTQQIAHAGSPLRQGAQAVGQEISSDFKTNWDTSHLGGVVNAWVEKNPQAAQDVAAIAGLGINIASIIPLVGTGAKAIGIMKDLGSMAAKGATFEELVTAAKSAVKTGSTISRTDLAHGHTDAITTQAAAKTVVETATPAEAPKPTIPARTIKPVVDAQGNIKLVPKTRGRNRLIVNDDGSMSWQPEASKRPVKVVDPSADPNAKAKDLQNQVEASRRRTIAEKKAQGPVAAAIRYIANPRSHLRDLGESGQKLLGASTRIDMANNQAARVASDIKAGLPKLTEAQAWQIEDVRNGTTPFEKADPDVQSWVRTWSPILDQELPANGQMAGVLGMTEDGDKIPLEYIEHGYTPQILDTAKLDEVMMNRSNTPLAKELQRQLGALNPQDRQAMDGLWQGRIKPKSPTMRGFQKERGEIRIPRMVRVRPDDAMVQHYAEFMREVNRARFLGPRNELATKWIKDIAETKGPTEGAWADSVSQTMRGIPHGADPKALSIMDAAANIGLDMVASPSFHIKHLTQITNTMRYTGIGRVAKTFFGFMGTPEGKLAMQRLGTYFKGADFKSIYEGRFGGGKLGSLSNYLTVGLPRTYRYMKVLSAGAGEELGKDVLQVLKSGKAGGTFGELTKDRAESWVRMAGHDPKTVLHEDPKDFQQSFGAFIAEDTFFAPTSLSVSQFAATPWGKAIMFLRQFATRQYSWWYDTTLRNQSVKDLPAIGLSLAMKAAGGALTTYALAQYRAAFSEVGRMIQGQGWSAQDFQNQWAKAEPSQAMFIVDSLLTGYANLLTETVSAPFRYPHSQFGGNDPAQTVIPFALSKASGVTAPLITAIRNTFAGHDVGQVVQKIGRDELKQWVPTPYQPIIQGVGSDIEDTIKQFIGAGSR